MSKVKSLYDALIKTKVEEDKCTNFLLWLLQRLPISVFEELCSKARLSLPQVDDSFLFDIQYPLDNSRPDALISLTVDKYLVLETKRFADSFYKIQFMNHYRGGVKEFGIDNVWILFLSGDGSIPQELSNISKKYPGKVGFIGWRELLYLLESRAKMSAFRQYRILIDEFIVFAKHLRLGRIVSMNKEDIRKFLDVYPFVCKYEEPLKGNFNKIFERIKDRCIIECNELLEESDSDNYSDDFPILYRGFHIRGWHISQAAYLFINIMTKTAGIVLTGYQDDKEKKKFLPLWEKHYKQKYKGDKNLAAFSWVEEGDDDYAIYNGYFKKVDGTTGKLFNPSSISEFEDTFYWGYSYPVDVNSMTSSFEMISLDCKRLLETFSGEVARKAVETRKKNRLKRAEANQ